MSLVSFNFWFFVILTTLIYFLVPKKGQWVVILIANIVFYACSGIQYLMYIFAIAAVTFGIAIKLEDITKMGTRMVISAESLQLKREVKSNILSIKKILCGVAIVFGMGIWVVLKYSNFFLSSVNRITQALHLDYQVELVSWILPLGMSFYTFHAVGYLVDVYRSKYKAERNFGKYFAFMAFFPHMVQGPFSRYDQLGKSILAGHSFSYDRLCVGCARILWGMFKKMVVADKLGIAVTMIFAHYYTYSGVYLVFAIFGYCIQVYADFSGYMDMVGGLSHILGIDLAENFRQPYFAKSVDEFWRRWHITLGKWFKDYVFYPVSMGKVGQRLGKWARAKWGGRMGKLVPGYFALIFVWSATGLWHGANWTYLVWGYLNLFVIMVSMQLSEVYEKVKEKLHIKSESRWWQVVGIVRTFCLVCFFRFFSTAPDLRTALSMIKQCLFHAKWEVLKIPKRLFVGMEDAEVYVVVAGLIFMLVVDIFREMGKWERIKERCPMLVKNVVYTVLIFAIMLIAGGDNDLTGGFMYANF